jgi:hypothetical protein
MYYNDCPIALPLELRGRVVSKEEVGFYAMLPRKKALSMSALVDAWSFLVSILLAFNYSFEKSHDYGFHENYSLGKASRIHRHPLL